ncbi:MAG: response regulator [Hyphomicrobiaceae bacterium]
MSNAACEIDQSHLLSGENEISWTPDTPVPSDIFVENMRRRGVDQIEITIPHADARSGALGVFSKHSARNASVAIAEEHMMLVIPEDNSEKSTETIVACRDITAIRVMDGHRRKRAFLEIATGGDAFHLGKGLPVPTLEWLRERLLLEAAGLVSRPLFNVGRRATRKTSNPDNDFYRAWPSGPNRLLSLFLQETPEKVRQLTSSIENEDWDAATKHCHWMKSTSAAVGAAQLSELCQRIEIDVHTRNFEQMEQLCAHLTREHARVSDSLHATVNGAPKPQSSRAPAAATSSPSVIPELQGTKILLVEDSLVNQEVARASLEEAGCITTVASDGQEALELFCEEAFDLILMDCQMPGVDGFEATRKIREIETIKLVARTPIVALTANALRDDRGRCLAAGMNDYLSKPYEEHEMLELLLKWLQVDVPSVGQEHVCAAE